jgi:hypothetical protein
VGEKEGKERRGEKRRGKEEEKRKKERRKIGCWWLMQVILATQKAEFRRIVFEDPILKKGWQSCSKG